MLEVRFYEEVEDSLLQFAVIFAKADGKWVFCKHKNRDTYEAPGGHREPGENILDTARRELFEETGAVDYDLKQIGIYSVIRKKEGADADEVSYGMLYYAAIKEFGVLPDYEIEKIIIQEELPEAWTYPLIQPKLIEKVQQMLWKK